MRKEFDDVDTNLIATVKRLCKHWFSTGRTIIVDSWFGPPLMTSKLTIRSRTVFNYASS